jgi:hypothetical protein
MATPGRLHSGSPVGPVDRGGGDTPDETGVGTVGADTALEEDLGAVELPDDEFTGDWRGDFGDSVGISSWRTL